MCNKRKRPSICRLWPQHIPLLIWPVGVNLVYSHTFAPVLVTDSLSPKNLQISPWREVDWECGSIGSVYSNMKSCMKSWVLSPQLCKLYIIQCNFVMVYTEVQGLIQVESLEVCLLYRRPCWGRGGGTVNYYNPVWANGYSFYYLTTTSFEGCPWEDRRAVWWAGELCRSPLWLHLSLFGHVGWLHPYPWPQANSG